MRWALKAVVHCCDDRETGHAVGVPHRYEPTIARECPLGIDGVVVGSAVPSTFLSYARADDAIFKALAEDTRHMGHDPRFDTELSGGQAWWDQIVSRIRDTDIFIFALSPESLDSTACKREWRYAADLGKTILPVLVADGVAINLLPPVLSQIQYVEYRPQSREVVARLARSINDAPPPGPIPDPLPEPPAVPVSYLGGLAERVETEAKLSEEEQGSLVLELQRALRDQENADDARQLLARMRKRDDLLVKIAASIDSILGQSRPVPGSSVRDAPGPPSPSYLKHSPSAAVSAGKPIAPSGAEQPSRGLVPPVGAPSPVGLSSPEAQSMRCNQPTPGAHQSRDTTVLDPGHVLEHGQRAVASGMAAVLGGRGAGHSVAQASIGGARRPTTSLTTIACTRPSDDDVTR